jgi:hypothetical protein
MLEKFRVRVDSLKVLKRRVSKAAENDETASKGTEHEACMRPEGLKAIRYSRSLNG